MRLTSKNNGGPSTFLHTFEEKYQDLEVATHSIVIFVTINQV
jgi:hypothetical protein